MFTAIRFAALTGGFLQSITLLVQAACCADVSNDDHIQQAELVCRGRVQSLNSFLGPEGMIWTRASVRSCECIKGAAPGLVEVVVPGGVVGRTGMSVGSSPQLRVGEERLFLLRRSGNGSYAPIHGLASAIRLTRQSNGRLAAEHAVLLSELRRLAGAPAAPEDPVSPENEGDSFRISYLNATNVLTDGFGVSPRFVAPDRGEPIPYLVDASFLPAGVSLGNALVAVSNAVTAWSGVTSLQFKFEGVQSFGAASSTINANDGRLRIQLHDFYGVVPGGSTLGIGGPWYSLGSSGAGGWGAGGSVAGVEFHRTTGGFVVLEHANTALANLATLTEVLCHEVGHAIGMAHSSENPAEPQGSEARQAIMYYQAHRDGRGASLNALDRRVVSQINPSNTPPFTFDRVLDVVTASTTPPSVAGINSVQLRAYDLQSTNLSLMTTNFSANNGTFSVAGNVLSYRPSGYFNSGRLDPAGTSYYDVAYFRLADGTNASPYGLARVLSFSPDSQPASGSDGLPDSWMVAYFGNANPNVGVRHRAGDDYDGDGLSNLQEFLAGSNPTNTASAQRITSFGPGGLLWQAKPYELYEVLESTNCITWTRWRNPVLPQTTNGLVSGVMGSKPVSVLRVLKVP